MHGGSAAAARQRGQHAHLQDGLRLRAVGALVERARVEEAPEEGLHGLECVGLLHEHRTQRRLHQRAEHAALEEDVRRMQQALEGHQEEVVGVVGALVARGERGEVRARVRDHWRDFGGHLGAVRRLGRAARAQHVRGEVEVHGEVRLVEGAGDEVEDGWQPLLAALALGRSKRLSAHACVCVNAPIRFVLRFSGQRADGTGFGLAAME